jgi:P-type Cu+ transporter
MGLFGFGKKEKDPVCGMAVDPKSAAGNLEHGGKTYHFCSASCQQKFKASPGTYA